MTNTNQVCTFCKTKFEGDNDAVPICDSCKDLTPHELARNYTILEDTSKNPMEMLLNLLKSPNVKMHGPEHHFIIPATLLSAYYNTTGNKAEKAEKIMEAEKRSKNILGGFCGFYGTCGAAIGNGIFYSLITNTTPKSTDTWKNAQLVTSRTLNSIGESGGPRCCKNVSYLALINAVDTVNKEFGVKMELAEEFKCTFSEGNPDCKQQNCRFNPSNF